MAPRYRRKNPAHHLRVHFTFLWVQSHMILIRQTNVKLKIMRPHASKIPANIWPGFENTFLSSLTFTSVCLQWIYSDLCFLLLHWTFSISPLNLTNEFFPYAVLAFFIRTDAFRVWTKPLRRFLCGHSHQVFNSSLIREAEPIMHLNWLMEPRWFYKPEAIRNSGMICCGTVKCLFHINFNALFSGLFPL